MKPLTLVIVIAAVAAAETLPPRVGVGLIERKLTLQEAIEEALRHNLEIDIEKTSTAVSLAAVRAGRGFYDPTFRWLPGLESRNTPTGSVLQGAGGKLTEKFHSENFYFRQRLPWQGSSAGLDFENNRSSSTSPFISLSPYITSRLLLSYTQPLWRNRLIDRDRAELRVRRKQVDVSDLEFELRVIDVVARTEQAYWDLVAARQDAAVKADTVEWAKQQLARNRRQIEAGTLAPVELAASEAELERRRDAWFAAIGTITETENALKVLLGGGKDETIWNDQIVPTEESTVAPPEIVEVAGAVTAAVKQRPEVRRLFAQQQITEVQKRQAADQVKPQVNLVASYANTGLAGSQRIGDNPISSSFAPLYDRLNVLSAAAGLPPVTTGGFGSLPGSLVGGYGTTLSNLFGGNYSTLTVGLAFDFTFRNNLAEGNLAQTAIAERRLKLLQTQTEQAIAAQVRNSLQALETARQRIAAADASARAAGQKLESETRLFQTGESTNFLVLTRQNELADARHRLLVARLDYNKAVARLEVALGTTLPAHQIEAAGRP